MAITDQELLDAARAAYLDVMQNGQDIMFNGRRYTKVNAPELWKAIQTLEARINNSSTSTIFDRSFTGAPYRGA